MMSPKEIQDRFPDLAVGEVIFVCPNGVVFNIGDESNRQKLSYRYCRKIKQELPEKVVGVTLEAESDQDDSAKAENKAEKPETASKPVPKKRNSKK